MPIMVRSSGVISPSPFTSANFRSPDISLDIGRYLDNIDKKFTRKDKTKMKQYDYLIIGSGLYGAVFAQQATAKGKRVLVIS